MTLEESVQHVVMTAIQEVRMIDLFLTLSIIDIDIIDIIDIVDIIIK